MKAALTEELIRRLALPDSGRLEVWDVRTPGLHVLVRPTGRITFHVFYRDGEGATHRRWLGVFGALSLEDARKAARAVAGDVARGLDPDVPGSPRTRKRRARADAEVRAREEAARPPTVAEAAEDFKDSVLAHRSRSYRESGERYLRRDIVPLLGEQRIDTVGLPDVVRLHESILAPYAANRAADIFSSLLTHAERRGWRPPGSNPSRRVPRHTEHVRHNPPSDEQLRAIGEALRVVGPKRPVPAVAFRVYALTGMRPVEVCTLRWGMVDLASRRVKLPASKTGARTVLLGAAAVEVLSAWEADTRPPREGAPVFPGRNPSQPIATLEHLWVDIHAGAKLPPETVLYDLRHGWGARAGARFPLFVVQALLGHRGRGTGATSHYARPLEPAILAAADELSTEIARLLDGTA